MTMSRREFFRHTSWALAPVMAIGQDAQQPLGKSSAQGKPPLNGATAADTLAMPVARASASLGPLDNDPGVIAIERKLRCTCGCTLDVYTCRTTDFSCTYSPAMHRDVVAQVQRGATEAQVLQWFVDQPDNGIKVLMSPPARGFNLMGYLVPGLAVAAVGLALAAWLVRRRATLVVVDAGTPGVARAADPHPDAEKLERLRRALDDVES
jgi:cytochrome c-type biogenesis protein CcmH